MYRFFRVVWWDAPDHTLHGTVAQIKLPCDMNDGMKDFLGSETCCLLHHDLKGVYLLRTISKFGEKYISTKATQAVVITSFKTYYFAGVLFQKEREKFGRGQTVFGYPPGGG